MHEQVRFLEGRCIFIWHPDSIISIQILWFWGAAKQKHRVVDGLLNLIVRFLFCISYRNPLQRGAAKQMSCVVVYFLNWWAIILLRRFIFGISFSILDSCPPSYTAPDRMHLDVGSETISTNVVSFSAQVPIHIHLHHLKLSSFHPQALI